MKHTIKLLTLAFMLAAILTLTGCPGPVDPENHDWVLENDTATCTENGVKTYKCSHCDETKTENSTAHHTFIAGGCDKCGTYEHNKEDDYQIRAYVYSSVDDAKKGEKGENARVLYFSFPASTEISKISLNSLIHMKSNYTKKTVSYIIIAASVLEEDEKNLYSMKDLDLDNGGPMYIVVE